MGLDLRAPSELWCSCAVMLARTQGSRGSLRLVPIRTEFLVKLTLTNLNPRTLQHVYQSGQMSSWCKRIQRLWISLQVQILLINVSSGLQCTKNCLAVVAFSSKSDRIVAVLNIAVQAGTPAVPIMDSTLPFQTKRCLQVLVPSIQFLLPPQHKISSDQTLPYIEVTSDMDMEHFKTLKEGHGKNELISVIKLSRKCGGD